MTVASPTPQPPLPEAFVPPPILMYHRVDVDRPVDRVGRDPTVSPAQFEEQLEYLKAHGIAAISMAELDRRLRAGESLDRTVVLTFDDGYADQYFYAVPLLQRYGDTATFYIITGNIGRRAHVTWPELQAMVSARMDIAAHGVRHDDLSKMPSIAQALQIDGSVRELRDRLHIPIESYAYPSGRFDAETLPLVEEANVPLAVTTDPAYVLPPENRFEIPRVRVRSEWSLGEFAAAIEAAQVHAHIVLSGQTAARNTAHAAYVLRACVHSPLHSSQRSLPCR